MTPGLDCETYCITDSHVIPVNVTAPLSYRILILLLKEFSSMVFNFRAVWGIELQLSRENYRFIDFYIKPLSIGPYCLGSMVQWSNTHCTQQQIFIWQKIFLL